MKYTPEQHLETARARERQAKIEANPNRKVALEKSAHLHRLAARAGRRQQAKQQPKKVLDLADGRPRDTFDIAFDKALDEVRCQQTLPVTGTPRAGTFERACYSVWVHGDGTGTVALDWYEMSDGRDFFHSEHFMRTEIETARTVVKLLNGQLPERVLSAPTEMD